MFRAATSATTTTSTRLVRHVVRSSRTRSYVQASSVKAWSSTKASSEDFLPFTALLAIGGAATMATATTTTAEEVNPAEVDHDDIENAPIHIDNLPEYTLQDIAKNNGENGTPIWMSYGGMVYDVTKFVANHPGGSEKIMQAAGNSVEPFWHIYRQHYASDLPMKLMEHLVIGTLREEDQDAIDQQMEEVMLDDPYAKEPVRHKALKVHSDTPMNAECPGPLLTQSYLTPPSLFYIRHHHPVPLLSQKEVQEYSLTIDLTAYGRGVWEIDLEDLKKLPKTEIVTTLQCSGNRRGDFNHVMRTSGTTWDQGAIGTAKWSGVKLSDLLSLSGVTDPIHAEEVGGMEHVRFYSLDGMMASIGIEKALNPYGDCLIAYEMNGEPLPRDHGFPLRAIVPGYAAVRNVKWLNKIELAATESEGPWQRGLNYKTLPPSVTDAGNIELEQMPSMTEASLFSGITHMEIVSPKKHALKPGEKVTVKCTGWAWAGGGRNIVRVDITPDNGKTWVTADLKEGSKQRFGRSWAWTFWECEVPTVIGEDGQIHLASKAIDLAFNVQPESCSHIWNVRGLGNNSWYRTTLVAATV